MTLIIYSGFSICFSIGGRHQKAYPPPWLTELVHRSAQPMTVMDLGLETAQEEGLIYLRAFPSSSTK